MKFFLGVTIVMHLFVAQCLSQTIQKEDIYLSQRKVVLEIVPEGDKLRITENHFEDIVFNKASNKGRYVDKSIYYSEFEEVNDIKAYSLIPAKSRAKKIKVDQIDTKDVLLRGVFYGGFKRKNFVFPSITDGSKAKLSYSKSILEPRLLTPFYFNAELPCVASTFVVKVSPNVQINTKLFGLNTDKVKFSQSASEGFNVLTWEMWEVPKIKFEEDAPARSYHDPHLSIYVTSYTIKGQRKKILGEVSDLYSWYSELIGKMKTREKSELDKVLSELPLAGKSDREKTKIIYQWVQSNIKYIAFEDGLHGFIPRNSGKVCNNKYGDCKDMANILHDMLGAAGIESYHTWIGTRKKPYSYKEMPTAVADNHMIAAVKLDGEYMFLDATGSFIPFGLPSPMIQGKEALIGLSANDYEVVKVPVVDQKMNTRIDSAIVSLKDQSMIVKGNAQLAGFTKLNFDYKYLQEESDERENRICDLLSKGNDKMQSINLTYDGLLDNNTDANFEYELKLEKSVKSVGGKMYFKPIYYHDLPGSQIDLAKRQYDIEKEFKYNETLNLIVEIPEGYDIDYLPENTSVNDELFGFNVKYEAVGNTVKIRLHYYSEYLYLSKNKFADWNNMLTAMVAARQDNIVLKRK